MSRRFTAADLARLDIAIEDEDIVYGNVTPFKFVGANYDIKSQGQVRKLYDGFNLWRLAGVRQLATLHSPVVTSTGTQGRMARMFDHSRLSHMADVCAVANLIALNNGLWPLLKRHIKVAALLHDAMMPAHGDAIKLIDLDAMDEDKIVSRLFEGAGWEALREKHQLVKTILVDSIQGRGLAGKIICVADRLSYVARDVAAYLRDPFFGCLPEYQAGHRELAHFVAAHPMACSIWETIHVSNDQIYFDDADRLGDFLKLRALAFREIYRHPGTRFAEVFFDRPVVGWLYRNGRLTADELRAMTDAQLEERMGEVLDNSDAFNNISAFGEPHVECFSTVPEAKARSAELGAAGCVALIDVIGKISPSTNLGVCAGNVALMPFCEAFPEKADEIESITRLKYPVRLYYLKSPNLVAKYAAALDEHREHQLKMIEEA